VSSSEVFWEDILHLKAYSRHLGVFGAVLKCHLVGRFNTGGPWRHLERYFFVTEWRFFADRVASSWHFLAPPAPGQKVRFVSIWRHQRPDEKSNASHRRYFFVAEWRFFATEWRQ
jgi:hypothetical protein